MVFHFFILQSPDSKNTYVTISYIFIYSFIHLYIYLPEASLGPPTTMALVLQELEHLYTMKI